MTKQSSHTSWRGCPVCKPYKHKMAPYKDRQRFSTLRKLGAKSRISRKTVECD